MSTTSYRWVLVLLLFVGACAGKGGPSTSGATVPNGDETTTTSSTLAAGIPETIDEAYVNGVLAALNHVYGDILRKRVATGRTDQDDLIPLRAIYGEPAFAFQADVLVKSPTPKPEEIHQPLGDRQMTVKRMLAAKRDCIALVVNYDFSAVVVNPPPVKDWYIVLRPTNPQADPNHLNPTPWSIAEDSATEVNPCGV